MILDIAAKVANIVATVVAMGDCGLKYGRWVLDWVRGPKEKAEEELELIEQGLAPEEMARRLARLEALLGVEEEAPPIPPRSGRRRA
ncbi:hypothetical protein H9Q70_012144 [Fusarium xylarioides]|nr:hypothetical protein H9Q70_012144 [Fusarium xylarioides]KAG5774505.1 hypothetical protein H9Q73_011713 [Fusarium xylarioides]